MYICFCSSYDFVAPFSLKTSTDRYFDMGTQSLVAGRNGILKLDFQKFDSLKVKCLYTHTHTHTHTQTHTQTHTYTHTLTHTHTNTHIHTYTYTHTHTIFPLK